MTRSGLYSRPRLGYNLLCMKAIAIRSRKRRPFTMTENIQRDNVTKETLAALQRFNDAFNRHDVDAVMAAMTEDCVFENTSPPSGQRYEGQDQVRAAWEEFFAASPTAQFDGE